MKTQSIFLSAAERARGMKGYLRYIFVNGVSFAFLSETVVILLAMQFGASNIEIGILSSAMYLTGIVSIFVPALFGGKSVMKFFFWVWTLRSLVCLGYVGVLVVQGRAAVLVIMATFLAYCVLRNSAYFLNQVIMAALSKRSELGRTSAKSLVAVNTSSTLSRIISFGVLSIPLLPLTIALLIAQAIGLVLNTASAAMLRRIPVRDIIERHRPLELIARFGRAMKTREAWVSLGLNLGGIMLLVLFTFVQPFLRGLQWSPSLILGFTVATSIGVILSGRFGQIFVDQFGSKPFLVLTHACIALLAGLWAILPNPTPIILIFMLGFVTMFFLGLVTMLTSRLVLGLLPQSDRVGFSAVLALLAGIAALVAGLGGGLLADLPPVLGPSGYSYTFLLLAGIALLNAVMSIFLKDEGSSSLVETARILFSVNNLRTFLSIDRLKKAGSSLEREETYLEIEYSSTPVASAEISRRLHIPLMREKEMLIRSLFTKVRPELLDQLLDEAQDRFSWWRQSAIFALGAYPGERSRAVLRGVLGDESPYLRSVAIKSLARIGDPESQALAQALLREKSADPRTFLNAIIALSLADKAGQWLADIFNLAPADKGYRFQQHILVIAAKRLGTEPGIEGYFYQENLNPGSGFEALIEEAREILAFFRDQDLLAKAAQSQDFNFIREWCRQSLPGLVIKGMGQHLAQAIMNSGDQAATPTDTLAMLYFTYQLHRDLPLAASSAASLPE